MAFDPIEYKIKDPNEIEITEMNVPSHWPNNIPEIIKIGDPKPRRTTQTIAKIENKTKLITMLLLIIISIFDWSYL